MKKFIITFCFLLACSAQAAKKPNIVYIISDDQAWTDYGFMGHAHIKTPNLDNNHSVTSVHPITYHMIIQM